MINEMKSCEGGEREDLLHAGSGSAGGDDLTSNNRYSNNAFEEGKDQRSSPIQQVSNQQNNDQTPDLQQQIDSSRRRLLGDRSNPRSAGGNTSSQPRAVEGGNSQGAQQQQQIQYEQPSRSMPPWIQAENISWLEQSELTMLKCFTYVPVMITFTVFLFIFIYYVAFHLYPTILGDYYGTWGIAYMWPSEEEMLASQSAATTEAIIFIFTSANLFISLIFTITTSPGLIPEEREWDMPDPSQDDMQRSGQEQRPDQIIGAQTQAQNQNQIGGPLTEQTPRPAGIEGPRGTAQSNISDMIRMQNIQTESHRQNEDSEQMINQEIQEDMENPRLQREYGYLRQRTGLLWQEHEQARENKGSGVLHTQIGGRVFFKSIERKDKGGVRMCQRCLKCKPDRCHHCSQCNQCILKMDHHCPWVANCIGFYNYKYFICMLFYTSVTCNMIAFTSHAVVEAVLERDGLPYAMSFFVVTAYVLACVFGFIITGFFCFHLWLIKNQFTTIEFCEKRTKDGLFSERSPYNLGCFENFKTILGQNILLWFIPCNRDLRGGGLYFAINEDAEGKYLRSEGVAQSQQAR